MATHRDVATFVATSGSPLHSCGPEALASRPPHPTVPAGGRRAVTSPWEEKQYQDAPTEMGEDGCQDPAARTALEGEDAAHYDGRRD